MFWTDQQQQIIERIKFGGAGMSNKDIAKNIVRFWRESEEIADMLDAQEYHLVRNIAIEDKNRNYLVPVQLSDGSYGEEERENTTLSNVKLKTPLMRYSVEQKINYGFAQPFVFEVALEGYEPTPGKEEPAELILYRNEWAAFINRVRNTIVRIATDAIINGRGCAYIWADKEFMLQIEDVPPNTAYPEWADRAHTILDAFVRDYVILQYVDGDALPINKVEYWDKNIVEFFIDDGGEWFVDIDMEAFALGDAPPPENQEGIPHLLTTGWGKVPFVFLKSNPNELPLLNIVRSYIDLIDYLKSKMADTLADDMDAILMLKKVSPLMEDLIRNRVNLKNSGVVSVDEGGGGEYLKNDPNIDAILKALESYYKDVLLYSATVDMNSDSRAIRQTQDALKMMYQPLDIFMNGMENLFRDFMQDLKWFFDKSLEFRNMGSMDIWGKYKINVTLDRDMMVSEAEIINNIMTLGSELSQETRDNQNPYVIDHKTEQVRREAERSAEDSLMMEFRRQQTAETQPQEE